MKSFRVWVCSGVVVLTLMSGTAVADTGETGDTAETGDTGASSSTTTASDRASEEGGSSCARGDQAVALFGLPLLAVAWRRRR